MTQQSAFDTEAVEALALALAEVGDMGDAYRAAPDMIAGQFVWSPERKRCTLTAELLLGLTRAAGYELTRAPR